jgi:hypothetical protein
MPFFAPRGAIRCDVVTRLSEQEVIEIATRAMTHNSTVSKLFASPDLWEPTPPPPGARAAFVRKRNKREERLHATSRGGIQDVGATLASGTVVAVAVESRSDGTVTAQVWTSSVNKSGTSGRIGAALEVRKRMRRFAGAISANDPGADVDQSEDDD